MKSSQGNRDSVVRSHVAGRTWGSGVLQFVLALACTGAQAASSYSALDLGNFGGIYGSGGASTAAYGINASGQVVGYSLDTNFIPRAFVTDKNGVGMRAIDLSPVGPGYSSAQGINDAGQVVGQTSNGSGAMYRAFATGPNGNGAADLGSLGGTWRGAFAVNSSGQVVGVSETSAWSTSHAFLVNANDGDMQDLGALGGNFSVAYAVNASGRAVGVSTYLRYSGSEHAFMTGANGQGMSDLGTLGGENSRAYGINESGQVVGYAQLQNSSVHAFITDANGMGMHDLGTLGGTSMAYGINTLGMAVGSSSIVGGQFHAFIADATSMIDLNALVSLGQSDYLTEARAINDAGQIVANSASGKAYLLTPFLAPVPEPTQTVLFAIGVTLLAAKKLSRRKASHHQQMDSGSRLSSILPSLP